MSFYRSYPASDVNIQTGCKCNYHSWHLRACMDNGDFVCWEVIMSYFSKEASTVNFTKKTNMSTGIYKRRREGCMNSSTWPTSPQQKDKKDHMHQNRNGSTSMVNKINHITIGEDQSIYNRSDTTEKTREAPSIMWKEHTSQLSENILHI